MAATMQASSYRVKFRRKEFLRFVEITKPRIINQRRRMHFSAYDGFVMYTFECDDVNFSQPIFEVIKFSNYTWSK